ncbi:MbtH family NRPS accessory protein [Streptomyces diastatochromogenes]|nr:MbtH family NRPS accessory protein [Streptomyces diastatochromogenes]
MSESVNPFDNAEGTFHVVVNDEDSTPVARLRGRPGRLDQRLGRRKPRRGPGVHHRPLDRHPPARPRRPVRLTHI